MRLTTNLTLIAPALMLAAGIVEGHVSTGRPGYGLIGYGIKMYDPICGFACQASVPKTLECPDDHHMDDMDEEEHMDMGPSAECLTTHQTYLQSLAWCMHTHCDISVANLPRLEKWWVKYLAGRQIGQPIPNISYQTAVEQVKTPPTVVLEKGEVLNQTVKVDEESYQANHNIYVVFEEMEINHSTTSIVVIVTSVAIPICLSLLRLLPFPATLTSKVNALLIDPPLFGSRHSVPIYNFAIVPTRGQALFIAYLISINIIMCSVGIRAVIPQTWFATSWYQVAAYVANRTGAISFANIPLLILFSGRNNILLWLTNWSYTTFLLIHRWIAWICTLQACIHSALYLGLYAWSHSHAEESKLAYWYWGIIATLALSLALPLSILPIRKMAYEVFLITHIALAIMAIAGSWYHIIYRYDHQWGYETWMYIAMAFWAFDRLVRLARMAGKGVHRAYVSRIDDDYLRITIPGVECQGHVYAYFPSLSWRVWENHPFSVINSIGTRGEDHTAAGVTDPKIGTTVASKEIGGSSTPSDSASLTSGPAVASPGITLFVRLHSGITSRLASKIGAAEGIPVLLEGSYGHESGALLKGSSAPTVEYPNTICIAGGVGITAVLAALAPTHGIHAPLGTTKLFWGVRHSAIVDSVEDLIPNIKTTDKVGVKWWGNIETHITVGERMNLREILKRELSQKKGTTVVVCGPESMADEVRCIVAGLGRHGAVVRFFEESFVW